MICRVGSCAGCCVRLEVDEGAPLVGVYVKIEGTVDKWVSLTGGMAKGVGDIMDDPVAVLIAVVDGAPPKEPKANAGAEGMAADVPGSPAAISCSSSCRSLFSMSVICAFWALRRLLDAALSSAPLEKSSGRSLRRDGMVPKS